MKLIAVLLLVLIFIACNPKDKVVSHNFSNVEIETIYKDSISVRALEIYNDTLLGFGFNKGYGFINLKTNESNLVRFEMTGQDKENDNWIAEQRAVGFVNNSFFSLGIGSPARLRKVNLKNKEERIVYTESHEKIFYDAIAFWNDNEGIAIGDPIIGCLSIIITRDAGETWSKVSCEKLPKTFEGEAAFAASNGNISIVGDRTWIVSGGMKSRVFYSPDRGSKWEVFDIPIVQGTSTTGAYSMDFYDKDNGIVFGGDYTKPGDNADNKAITTNGGKTWQLIANNQGPGYKSCVRYVPNSGGKEVVVVGVTGISISNDFGRNWAALSNEGFYTLRFLNDSIAIASGNGRISKVTLK